MFWLEVIPFLSSWLQVAVAHRLSAAPLKLVSVATLRCCKDD